MNLKDIICDFFKIKTDKKIEVVECKHETKKRDVVDVYSEWYGSLRNLARMIAKRNGWHVLNMATDDGLRFDVLDDGDRRILKCFFIIPGSPTKTPKIILRGRRSEWDDVEPSAENLKFLMYEDE